MRRQSSGCDLNNIVSYVPCHVTFEVMVDAPLFWGSGRWGGQDLAGGWIGDVIRMCAQAQA